MTPEEDKPEVSRRDDASAEGPEASGVPASEAGDPTNYFLPPHLQRNLPPDVVALALQISAAPATSGNGPSLDLTDEQKGQLIAIYGRQSDQENDFKKWLLVSACLIFCFVVLVVIGLIVFMVMQDKTAILGPILSGLGGLVAGLASGIGGTYWYVSNRR